MNRSTWTSVPIATAVVLTLARPLVITQAPEGSKAAGQPAYDRVCHVCHGPEGRGDGAPRLVPFSRSYEELLAIVRDGSGQMPPISVRQLTDEEVGEIVEYLKSLSDGSR